MGLKIYRHRTTGEYKTTLVKLDPEIWEDVITAPNAKFMEKTDPIHNKSRLKDNNKVLKARARNYARDHEIDEHIQINRANGLDEQVNASFLNKQGRRRRKIDDI